MPQEHHFCESDDSSLLTLAAKWTGAHIALQILVALILLSAFFVILKSSGNWNACVYICTEAVNFSSFFPISVVIYTLS